MANTKRLNRNAFNEKLIHRYLFERYYFADKKIRNKLLPKQFHKNEINLVVPEENKTGKGYRADLTIYFKDRDDGIPVEVKWTSSNFQKKNQVNYLKENRGFVVSFDSIDLGVGVENIKIDHEDFMVWVSENISKLSRESLIYQVNIDKLSTSNQYWCVYLRGTSHQNFYKMLKEFPKNTFWAFKQNKHALKNIMDIQKGDMIVFILGVAKEGMGMTDNPKLSSEFKAWFVGRVKEPYYMILDGDKGTFFEEGNIKVNKRRWPHFMDFEILEKHNSDKVIDFGKRDEFSKAFAESVNYGSGAPAPLLRRQWDSLVDRLRKLSS